ncbi:MAG: hypothetical protein V4695_03545 [Pseudomonadota bacterium]
MAVSLTGVAFNAFGVLDAMVVLVAFFDFVALTTLAVFVDLPGFEGGAAWTIENAHDISSAQQKVPKPDFAIDDSCACAENTLQCSKTKKFRKKLSAYERLFITLLSVSLRLVRIR